jgi:hypothetical protein
LGEERLETTNSTKVTPGPGGPPPPEEQLNELFGSYKAEWLRERLFDFFTAPGYMPELMTPRPCVLVGGRGTGKTTVLRALSYEGHFALSGRQGSEVPQWEYYGMYLRINTNRVMAFAGPELDEQGWMKVFAHYFNLVLCDLVLRFLDWYRLHTGTDPELSPRKCRDIAESLHIPTCVSTRELLDNVNSARLKFEAYINNIADGNRPLLSMQGAPLDALFEDLGELDCFADKTFFFLLDEYENFQDYQQQVVNTLLRHSGQRYSFKIGVRELGWRVRSTLNVNEQLISPADYVRINIVEKLEGETFKRFARSVCDMRLARLVLPNKEAIPAIEHALPGLTEEEEALKLGVEHEVTEVRRKLEAVLPPDELSVTRSLTPLQIYFVKFWAEWQGLPLEDVVADMIKGTADWNTRFSNYKHSLLYTIRSKKRGIRRYYAGWDVFAQLAAGNIRYLIELVDQSLLLHLREGKVLSEQVSVETQTIAAQSVGKKNLSELEGLSVHGAQLTKLILGLGRIFQVMAAQPGGHAPEINQFHVDDDGGDGEQQEDADRLLKSAVMQLALARFTGSKPADEGDTRDYDYMIHPIFSAFFVFSYRRKRKMLLSAVELLGLVKEPRDFIRAVLLKQNRSADSALPEQMRLFEAYYGHNS